MHLRLKRLIYTLFTLSVYGTLLLTTVVSGSSSSSKNSKNSLTVQSNANETQQISILVGGPRIGPLAEGDEEDGEDGGGNDEKVEPTGYDRCQGENKCCYQFTWQGFVQDIPADPTNTTCEQLRIDKKANDMACFDPIVYTIADGNGRSGRGPNVTQLEADARENNWNIYCPLTNDKSCLTLKYFSRGKGKQIVNETRFCGSITETITGSRLSSGCWEQSVQGYVRQVCSCTTSICNGASGTSFSSLFLAMGVGLGVVLVSGVKIKL